MYSSAGNSAASVGAVATPSELTSVIVRASTSPAARATRPAASTRRTTGIAKVVGLDGAVPTRRRGVEARSTWVAPSQPRRVALQSAFGPRRLPESRRWLGCVGTPPARARGPGRPRPPSPLSPSVGAPPTLALITDRADARSAEPSASRRDSPTTCRQRSLCSALRGQRRGAKRRAPRKRRAL